jgi:hypothetical protein
MYGRERGKKTKACLKQKKCAYSHLNALMSDINCVCSSSWK